jgi:hypothetical protein
MKNGVEPEVNISFCRPRAAVPEVLEEENQERESVNILGVGPDLPPNVQPRSEIILSRLKVKLRIFSVPFQSSFIKNLIIFTGVFV